MNILYVISSLAIGGAEISLLNIANEAVKRGNRVTIVCLTLPDTNFIKKFNNNITIFTINLKSLTTLSISFFIFNNICKIIKPDIIHSHMIHANLFVGFYKILFNIKITIIVTAHSINEGFFSFLYLFLRNSYNNCIHISLQGLHSYIKKKYFSVKISSYIPNGVSQASNTGEDYFVLENKFITVGRLVEVKNHILMIDTIIRIRIIYKDVSLYIYGDGIQKSVLQKYIDAQGADGFIFLCGSIADPFQVLANSKYFLLSSRYEGMPLALLEACQVGLPCVTTNVGGCSEILHDLPSCFIADLNLPNDYYNKVLNLLAISNSELAKSKPVIRQKIAQHYSFDKNFNSHFIIYNKFITG